MHSLMTHLTENQTLSIKATISYVPANRSTSYDITIRSQGHNKNDLAATFFINQGEEAFLALCQQYNIPVTDLREAAANA